MLDIAAAGTSSGADVEEVINYVEAMRWGMDRLDELPISARLLREMHRRLTRACAAGSCPTALRLLRRMEEQGVLKVAEPGAREQR